MYQREQNLDPNPLLGRLGYGQCEWERLKHDQCIFLSHSEEI